MFDHVRENWFRGSNSTRVTRSLVRIGLSSRMHGAVPLDLIGRRVIHDYHHALLIAAYKAALPAWLFLGKSLCIGQI